MEQNACTGVAGARGGDVEALGERLDAGGVLEVMSQRVEQLAKPSDVVTLHRRHQTTAHSNTTHRPPSAQAL